jgi:AcrR family transcriptional regulator
LAGVPRQLDADARRRELGEAAWRVIRRDGLDHASVRNVAREAGLSAGSLRHSFPTQAELLAFAMDLVGDRVQARIAALDRSGGIRAVLERSLAEVIPLDGDRRAEFDVWLAFVARARVDPALRAKEAEIYDSLMRLYRGAIDGLAAAGELAPGTDREREALRLGALVDGLALHTAMRADRIGADEALAVVRRHLDSLRP